MLSSFPLAAVRAWTRARTPPPSLTGSRQGHQGHEGRGERREGSRGPGVAARRVLGQTPCRGELVAVATWPATQSPASEWAACRFCLASCGRCSGMGGARLPLWRGRWVPVTPHSRLRTDGLGSGGVVWPAGLKHLSPSPRSRSRSPRRRAHSPERRREERSVPTAYRMSNSPGVSRKRTRSR